MNITNNTLKALGSASLILLLANCASKEQLSTQQAPVATPESKKIILTGSRIKGTDIENPAPTEEPLPQSPAIQAERLQPRPAAEALEELLALVKQNKAQQEATNKQRESLVIRDRNNQVALLSEIDKERLYRVIDNSPEASGQIFKRYRVNPTIQTEYNPVSTFSMDADNGSFKLASAMLRQNQLPHSDGIRIEEFVNSMKYQYSQSEQLFSISAEAMPSPFRSGYHILHLGVQTKNLKDNERNPSNLVMVADVSGSMASDNKLDLLKKAMTTLVSQLDKNDQIALVVYNDDATIVLEPTFVAKKRKIFNVINQLQSGGSTNAEQGLIKGYELAEKMFQPGFNNRVILTSDGMANVGSTSPEAILRKISESKDKGIFLTTLGVGKGMYNDYLLEQLADQGNGNYLYIANDDDIQDAFVDELNSQLQTVAKDAKIQVTFNPDLITNYRLLGYENRHLEQEDFLDANKDGGELGAGHKVTAIYEIKISPKVVSANQSLGSLSIAYKKPQGNKVQVLDKNLPSSIINHATISASPDSRLSFAVAAFAEKLRQSYWARLYSYTDILLQLNTLPTDYRRQAQVIDLIELINLAQNLDSRVDDFETQHPVANINFDRVPLLD